MDAYRVIRRPHNSEKAHEYVQEDDTYVFQVDRDATKTDIRRAVEKIWNVRVRAVRTLNQPGKIRRYGRIQGRSNPWKKAMVRLHEGQAIEALR
jgi:large subunit ribosomal protein L23